MGLLSSPGVGLWPGATGTSPDQGGWSWLAVLPPRVLARLEGGEPADCTGAGAPIGPLHPQAGTGPRSPASWRGRAGPGRPRSQQGRGGRFPRMECAECGVGTWLRPTTGPALPTSLGPQFPRQSGSSGGREACLIREQPAASGTAGAPGAPQTLLGTTWNPSDHRERLRAHGCITWRKTEMPSWQVHRPGLDVPGAPGAAHRPCPQCVQTSFVPAPGSWGEPGCRGVGSHWGRA